MSASCQKTKILLHCAYDMWIEHRKAYGSKLENAAMESQSLNEKFAFHLLELHTLCNSCYGPPGDSVSGPRLCPAAPAPSAEDDCDILVPAMNMGRESPASVLEQSMPSKCQSSPHSASASVRSKRRLEHPVHWETSPATKSKTLSPGDGSPDKRISVEQPIENDDLYQVLNIKEEEQDDWAEDTRINEEPTDLERSTSDQYLDNDINQDELLQMVAESVYAGSHTGFMPKDRRKQALQLSSRSTLITKQIDLQVSDVDSPQELQLQQQQHQKRMKQATMSNLPFDVEHILRTNAPGGAALVDKMKRQRTIDRSGNRLFVQTLVNYLITHYGYNPSPNIKAALAQSIIQQFEFLGDKNGVTGYEQWFVRGKRNLPATGSLEARLRYIRRVHFPRETKRKPVDHQKEHPTSSKAKKIRVDPIKFPEVHEDEVKEATIWMKENGEPKVKVEECMRKTCKHRYDWIRAENPPTITEVLDRYPCLLDTGIIDADYRQAISEKTADNLYAKWPRIAPRILQYADLQELKWRRELEMENSTRDELSEEEQQMLAFSLLPLLFMGRCKDKSGRCSAVNSLKSFINHIPESTDMTQYLTETRPTERPPTYILTRGGTRWKPLQTFLILDHRTVPCSSLIEAVDVCFKAIYLLDIEYHPHTCSVMEFLQHIIYGVPPGTLVRSGLISFRTWLHNWSDT